MNKINSLCTDLARNVSNHHTAGEQQYVAPKIEIIDIEMEQNILGGSTDAPLPDMPGGGDW